MTREEAIEILQGAIKKPNTKDGYLGQAIDMAIKALEQEPCEDAISRQAVLDIIDSDWEYEGMEQYINDLSSVTPCSKIGQWISDKCSICGKGIEDLISSCEWYKNETPNYCPFCGAKIESEDA